MGFMFTQNFLSSFLLLLFAFYLFIFSDINLIILCPSFLYKIWFTIANYHYNFNKFIISFTITSFSSAFDSAIINVIATKAPSLSLFSPSWNNALFLSKNSRNSDAAILLQPSAYSYCSSGVLVSFLYSPYHTNIGSHLSHA